MRYLDLFMYFISFYNTLMKIFFIGATGYAIYLMRFKKPYCTVRIHKISYQENSIHFFQTYDIMGDSFPHFKVLMPAALVITLIINSGWEMWELVWSYSLWLESVAFIPQIFMLNKMRVVENITSHYVVCLGLYRIFYILNW